ncbi:hypothetical protein ACTXT7_009855 [Hymenolepis weldensis]
MSNLVIRNAEMSQEMQRRSVDLTKEAMQRHTVEKDIAGYIKKGLDQQYGSSWHCVVGKSFGSYISHVQGHLIYLNMNSYAVLIFKTA